MGQHNEALPEAVVAIPEGFVLISRDDDILEFAQFYCEDQRDRTPILERQQAWADCYDRIAALRAGRDT